MTIAVYVSVYLAVLLFIIGAIARAVRYARTPIHLRWELYPVPHEEPARAEHGGSYFEAGNWWTKPQPFNRIAEWRAMGTEIALLHSLRENNRRLWYASFLFHVGLYLTFAAFLLVCVQVALFMTERDPLEWLHLLYVLIGYAAVALTLSGAIALLFRRLSDPTLKNYTSAADLFNLHFFIITYGVLAAGYLVRPAGSANMLGLVWGLLTFDTTLIVGRGFAIGVFLACVLLAYIPFTHMAHFIAKYFTYHWVRWDDRPNVRGGRLESKLAPYFAYRPTWSAPHIGATGEKTWAELASSAPAAEVRK